MAGFTTAVVMGMGGSSLAPDVLRRTFGTAEGYLDLRILDSTDPAAVAAAVDDLDPLATLWIVASKSGTTTEPLAFLADAWARVSAALEAAGSDQAPGEFFVAITDPGHSVAVDPPPRPAPRGLPQPAGHRRAVLGAVVRRARAGVPDRARPRCAAGLRVGDARRRAASRTRSANPGLLLGLALGELARAGRDKLTFVADPALAGFGAWAEQLIAESTGKHGVGIVPVDREPLGSRGVVRHRSGRSWR